MTRALSRITEKIANSQQLCIIKVSGIIKANNVRGGHTSAKGYRIQSGFDKGEYPLLPSFLFGVLVVTKTKLIFE